MKILERILGSSLGKKYVMAISGLIMVGFVVGHLAGNLQIFLGPEAINSYGHFLKSNPEIIWPARIGLLIALGLHVWAAITLTRQNRAARPVAYSAAYKPTAASYASRTMIMSGLILAAFILYHLMHFTILTSSINLTGKDFHSLIDTKGRHDVFAMMVTGFRHPVVTAFYLLAMALLCLHLSHGIGAMFQSIGLKNKAWTPVIDRAGAAFSWLLFVGYSSIPIAILLGYGKEIVK